MKHHKRIKRGFYESFATGFNSVFKCDLSKYYLLNIMIQSSNLIQGSYMNWISYKKFFSNLLNNESVDNDDDMDYFINVIEQQNEIQRQIIENNVDYNFIGYLVNFVILLVLVNIAVCLWIFRRKGQRQRRKLKRR